ncbi:hypothetical protein ATO2_09865 [Roseovarius sp. 22II1-1F6A]|nr:hypothetical protein ATO2_09865 [Roseovarius sp. 22II1-1F6A]
MFTTNDKFISIPDLRRTVLEATINAKGDDSDDFDWPQLRTEVDQTTLNVIAEAPRGFLLSPLGSVVQVGPEFLQRSSPEGHFYVDIYTGLTVGMRRAEWHQRLLNDDLIFYPNVLRVATFLLLVAGITFWLTISFLLIRDTAQRDIGYPQIVLMVTFYTGITLGVLYAALCARNKAREYIEMREDVVHDLKGFEGMSLMLEKVEVEKFLTPEADPTTASIAEEERVARRIVAHVEAHGTKLKRGEAAVMFGSNLGTRAFGRAWSKATAQHPALGRPGPKG